MKTAVEWLMWKSTLCNGNISAREWQQAKEMEKKQIIETYIAGSFTGCGCYDYMEEEDGELYYNETFKSE